MPAFWKDANGYNEVLAREARAQAEQRAKDTKHRLTLWKYKASDWVEDKADIAVLLDGPNECFVKVTEGLLIIREGPWLAPQSTWKPDPPLNFEHITMPSPGPFWPRR